MGVPPLVLKRISDLETRLLSNEARIAGKKAAVAAVESGGGSVYDRGAEFKKAGFTLIAAEADVEYVRVPVSGTITKAITYGTAAGSCVFDVFLGAYGGTTSIAASAKPTLTADDYHEDSTLTGWTTTVTAGQWLGFELESSSGQIVAGCVLEITPS